MNLKTTRELCEELHMSAPVIRAAIRDMASKDGYRAIAFDRTFRADPDDLMRYMREEKHG